MRDVRVEQDFEVYQDGAIEDGPVKVGILKVLSGGGSIVSFGFVILQSAASGEGFTTPEGATAAAVAFLAGILMALLTVVA